MLVDVKRGNEDLHSVDLDASLIIQSLALAGAAIGGGFSICIYWKTAKTRRAEWLYSLYAKFYEDAFCKRIRVLLDYRPEEELNRLYRGLDEGSCPELCEQLVDYLNFFEFIGSLWTMRQLTINEIKMLFDYYLKLIPSHKPVMVFVETQGFENLQRLLACIGAKEWRN
jgi:hypothetical protein